MTASDDGKSLREKQLEQALVEYLDAIDSGRELDTQSLLARYPDVAG